LTGLARGVVDVAIRAWNAVVRLPEWVARTLAEALGLVVLAARASARFLVQAVRPTALKLYVGLPAVVAVTACLLALVLRHHGGAWAAPELMLYWVAVLVAAAAVLWLIQRTTTALKCRALLVGATDGAPGRVVHMEAFGGARRLVSSGHVKAEVGVGCDRVLLVVTLLAGQSMPDLDPGTQMSIFGPRLHDGAPVVICTGTSQWLLGRGVAFGPVRITDADVLNRSRLALRSRMLTPFAAGLVLISALGLSLWLQHGFSSAGTGVPGSLVLVGAAWIAVRARNLRGFTRVLSRGGHARAARAMGCTRARRQERALRRDTVWVEMQGSSGAVQLEVTLLPGQQALAFHPGEPVTVYGSDDGHAPLLLVGSKQRSSLLGWGRTFSISAPPERPRELPAVERVSLAG
jgi:hypothetical protein